MNSTEYRTFPLPESAEARYVKKTQEYNKYIYGKRLKKNLSVRNPSSDDAKLVDSISLHSLFLSETEGIVSNVEDIMNLYNENIKSETQPTINLEYTRRIVAYIKKKLNSKFYYRSMRFSPHGFSFYYRVLEICHFMAFKCDFINSIYTEILHFHNDETNIDILRDFSSFQFYEKNTCLDCCNDKKHCVFNSRLFEDDPIKFYYYGTCKRYRELHKSKCEIDTADDDNKSIHSLYDDIESVYSLYDY
jgi:hypothetical protein